MSERTKIAWCDSTANPVIGCDKVSAGCKNCYAMFDTPARVLRHRGIETWGPNGDRYQVKGFEKSLLAMNRKPWICDECGKAYPNPQAHFCERQEATMTAGETGWHRRRVFINSNSDWLDLRWRAEVLAHMFDVIRRCPDIIHILCTKRPESFEDRMAWALNEAHDLLLKNPELEEEDRDDKPLSSAFQFIHHWVIVGNPPPNVILLTSVENQEMADERIPELLRIPAACRGLSLEPLLGDVKLEGDGDDFEERSYLRQTDEHGAELLNWLIVGGESGPNARPCNIEWVRSLVRQGQAAGVPVFVKQLGANSFRPSRGEVIKFPRHPKGGDPDEWPDDLQVRQFPFRPTAENQPKNPAESAAESRVTVQAES